MQSPRSLVVVTPRTQATDKDVTFTSMAKKNNKKPAIEDVSTPALRPFGSLDSGDDCGNSTGTLGLDYDDCYDDFDVEVGSSSGHAMIPVFQLK